jgi:anaphase-promoting complex subunit 6
LGHTLRKLRQWDAALECYQAALGLRPGQPGTYSALGYTHHLRGDLHAAIENYHKVGGRWCAASKP